MTFIIITINVIIINHFPFFETENQVKHQNQGDGRELEMLINFQLEKRITIILINLEFHNFGNLIQMEEQKKILLKNFQNYLRINKISLETFYVRT